MDTPELFKVEFTATLGTEADAELVCHWLRGVGAECVSHSVSTSLESVGIPSFMATTLTKPGWVESVDDNPLMVLLAAAEDALKGADARHDCSRAIWEDLRMNPRVSPESVLLAAVRCFEHQRVCINLALTVIKLWKACKARDLPCSDNPPDALVYFRTGNIWATSIIRKENIPAQERLAPLTMARLLRVPDVPDLEVRRRIDHLNHLFIGVAFQDGDMDGLDTAV